MRNDQIFVLLLVILLPMSGCFDGAVGDAEGTDESEVGEEALNNSTNNENPLIYVWHWQYNNGPVTNCQNRTTCTFTWTISVMDIDGNISSVGIDSDLDGVIDHEFVSDDWTQHVQDFVGPVDWSTDNAVKKKTSHEWCYFAFNLIAIDDDGGKSIHPITEIVGECD